MAKKICINLLCKNVKTRTQILCCSTILSLFTVLFVMLLEQLLVDQIQNTFSTSSTTIFEQQTKAQLRQFLAEQVKYAEWFFLRGENQILAINQLFQLVQAHKLESTVPSYDCLTNSLENDTYAYNLSFCYMFASKTPNLTKNAPLLNLAALMTQNYEIFSTNRYIYFTDYGNDSLFVSHVGQNFAGYNPHIRPWYLKYINNLDKHQYYTAFSDPYFTWAKYVAIAQDANLTNLNGDLAGIVGQDFQLKHMILMNSTEQMLIVVNESGYIMVGSYYVDNYNKFVAVYDTAITGFTWENWIEIKHAADTNSDTILKIISQKSLLMQLVTAQKIRHPKYYFIIFSEFPKITEDRRIIEHKLVEFQNQYVNQLILVCIGLVIIILLQIGIVIYILRPVEKLNSITQNKIHDKFKSLENSYFTAPTKTSGTINKLLMAYHYMKNHISKHRITKKSPEYIALEQIQYPINLHQEQFYSNLIQYLPNYEKNEQFDDTICGWMKIRQKPYNQFI